MGKHAMRPRQIDGFGSASAKPKDPKLSAFAKLLREHIGIWANVPSGTATPDREARAKFLSAFDEHRVREKANVAKPTPDAFDNWWKGKNRPAQTSMAIVVLILLGRDEARKRQQDAIWKAWSDADVKAARRKGSSVQPKKDPVIPSGGGFVSSPTKAKPREPGKPQAVNLLVDFAGVGQNMLEGGLPVVVDVNWRYEVDDDVACKLYLREFHLLSETENCVEVPGSYVAENNRNSLSIRRLANVWEFRAGEGQHLEGKCPDIEQLFVVKQSADADGLPSVKVTGLCPGSKPEFFDFEWDDNAAPTEADKRAVIERFLAKCIGTGKKGPAVLDWAAVKLVERKP